MFGAGWCHKYRYYYHLIFMADNDYKKNSGFYYLVVFFCIKNCTSNHIAEFNVDVFKRGDEDESGNDFYDNNNNSNSKLAAYWVLIEIVTKNFEL
jgi:hypothetical protein